MSLRESENPVAVALSAGADSTAALLWALGNFATERIIALHYHHNLRGPDADADCEHARRLAESLGVGFLTEKRPAGRPANESSLRDDRIRFLMAAARAAGAAAVIQGHHADDVAESLLMRLGRGSGTAGLSAPRPVSALPDGTPILRPLLALKKAELENLVRSARIAWRHDASNDDPSAATRNRIRHGVTKPWAEAIPGDAIAGAARTRMLLQEDDDALNAWAETLLTNTPGAGTNAEGTIRLPRPTPPRAVMRRVIHMISIRPATGTRIAAPAMDAMLDAIEEDRPHRTTLSPEFALRYRHGILTLSRNRTESLPRAEASLPVPGAAFWPDGASLTADYPIGAEHTVADNSLCVLIRPSEQATLRCTPRLSGDRYRPLGAPGTQKLHDAMINRKIPSAARNSLPVVRDDHGILWCPGLLPSELARLSESDLRPLRLTWNPPAAAYAALPVT